MALAQSFPVIIAGAVVFGFGIGWFVPNLMTASMKNVPASRQGRAVGLLKGVHLLASPLGVVLVEPVTRVMGPQGAILVVALLSFAALGVFVFRLVSRRAAPPMTPDPSIATQ